MNGQCKGSVFTALNRLSHCLSHISLALVHTNVLISIDVPIDAALDDFHCSNVPVSDAWTHVKMFVCVAIC